MPNKPTFNNLKEIEHDIEKGLRRMPKSADPAAESEMHQQGDINSVVAATSPDELSADVVNRISEEGHPVPVILITDHFAEIAQGIEPATCKICGAPMELHSQFEPTMQHYEEDTPVESLSSHLASVHGMLDLGELDPVDDGLILDRLYEIHEAKHSETTKEAHGNHAVYKDGKCTSCGAPMNDIHFSDCIYDHDADAHYDVDSHNGIS